MIEDKFALVFDKFYQTLNDSDKDLLLADVQSGLFHVLHTYLDLESDVSLLDQYKDIVSKHPSTVDKYENSHNLCKAIFNELVGNNDKLSKAFIDSIASAAEVTYLRPTPNMRLCILKLPTGHEVLGKAQVLDELNDVEELGNKVAYDNAVNELWGLCGAIAKLYIG